MSDDEYPETPPTEAAAHSCGGGHAEHDVKPSAGAKYFCPMCPGVESDQPGACPKCGMALERNPAWKAAAKTLYTCPMHPEIEQDHPGACPKCGMALEPKTVAAEPEESDLKRGRRWSQRKQARPAPVVDGHARWTSAGVDPRGSG